MLVPLTEQEQALRQVTQPLGYPAGVVFPLLAGAAALGVLVFLFAPDRPVPARWQELGRPLPILSP